MGRCWTYDVLVVATGAEVVPEETPGMKGAVAQGYFDFYTFEGSTQLAKNWKPGRAATRHQPVWRDLIKCRWPCSNLLFWLILFHGKGCVTGSRYLM